MLKYTHLVKVRWHEFSQKAVCLSVNQNKKLKNANLKEESVFGKTTLDFRRLYRGVIRNVLQFQK